MNYQQKIILSSLTTMLFSPSVLSQSLENKGIFANVDTDLVYDDNIYRVTDDLATSDKYLTVSPDLKFVGGFGKHRFQATYKGDYGKFAEEQDADYADHDIVGRADFSHSLRFSSRLEAGYQKDHEEPGSINRIQLSLTEYNKFEQKYFLGRLVYGQEEAIGRFAVTYRLGDKNYLNNGLDYLDYTSNQITGRFTYRLAPKTQIYAEASSNDLDYEPGTVFELDNTYNRYLLGITWDFANKLSADLNIGYQNRDYDESLLRDIDGLAYTGEVNWKINSYTELAFEAKRESIDSSLEDAGGFLRNSYGLSLKHGLSELLKLNIDAGYADDELVFSSSREDKRYAFKIGLTYEILRNLDVGMDYSYEERDSTEILADFKANMVALRFSYNLES